MKKFYVGMFNLYDCHLFDRSFVSANRLWKRRSLFKVNDWIMDSGAFSEIEKHGKFIHPKEEYLDVYLKFLPDFFVSQDYLVFSQDSQQVIKNKQRETIERFEWFRSKTDKVIPVIHGNTPKEYIEHLKAYDFPQNAYIGVGSLVPKGIGLKTWILEEVKSKRPDLRLHCFGFKKTELLNQRIRKLVYSADSMAWSFIARMNGRSPHDPNEAKAFEQEILNDHPTDPLPLFA